MQGLSFALDFPADFPWLKNFPKSKWRLTGFSFSPVVKKDVTWETVSFTTRHFQSLNGSSKKHDEWKCFRLRPPREQSLEMKLRKMSKVSSTSKKVQTFPRVASHENSKKTLRWWLGKNADSRSRVDVCLLCKHIRWYFPSHRTNFFTSTRKHFQETQRRRDSRLTVAQPT